MEPDAVVARLEALEAKLDRLLAALAKFEPLIERFSHRAALFTRDRK